MVHVANINATATGDWEAAIDKARAFVAQLTIEEKADMVTGQAGPCVGNIVAVPRLGFRGLCLHDGPLAIRVADYASVFPAGVSAGGGSRQRATLSCYVLTCHKLRGTEF